jgi:hypothetical protein
VRPGWGRHPSLLDGMMVGGHHDGSSYPRMLVVVSAIAHHGQWSEASFMISREEWCFCSISLKIKIAR